MHHELRKGASMKVKFLMTLPVELRVTIKREARKHDLSMNDYMVTVLEQFIAIQGGNNGNNTKRGSR